MPITKETLARRLRAAREACGLTQEEVARRLGVSRPTIAQMELGNRDVTSLELERLAGLYGRDIREFFAEEFAEEDALAAFFRAHPEASTGEALVAALRGCAALGRELANLERILGLDWERPVLPAYDLPIPKKTWEAVQQGERVAEEERRRLGLGNAAVPELAELLESQGIRTAELELPEDVSGLTLPAGDLGIFVVVNRRAPGRSPARRRFSLAHEYCHALLDRGRRGAVSRVSESGSLQEVRANAFAAAFLMPKSAVEDFVLRLGKGGPGRLRAEVHDGSGAQSVEARRQPGSREIRMHDVVLLAGHFGVSRLAALYRLKSLRFLDDAELERLKAEETAGLGKALADALGLPDLENEDPACRGRRMSFRARFLALALEAYRRAEITRAKLAEILELADVPRDEAEKTIAAADGTESEEENGVRREEG